MIIEAGEKVHIIERRKFAEDVRRHFIGEVISSSENAFRVKGYVWVGMPLVGFIQRPEKRERAFYPDTALVINIIPKDTDLSEIKYVSERPEGLVVTDSKNFRLVVDEFGLLAR